MTDLASISKIRAQLEPLAAARAARVATPAARENLRSVMHAAESFEVNGASVVETLRLDARVHKGMRQRQIRTWKTC